MGMALTGNDTISLNGRVFADFADGNCAELKFPNGIAKVKIGKNGNAIFAQDNTGQMSELTLKLLRGSSDDQYLNAQMTAQQLNFAGSVLQFGEFIKKVGDGSGNITSDTYVMSGGIFTKIPEAKTNAEGDTDQSTVLYTIQFANQPAIRAIS